jgi:hypothetical protein
MSNPLNFLGGDPAPEPEIVQAEPAAEAPPAEAAPEGPARGPDGRFAPKASDAAAEPQAAPEPVPAPAEPQHAPLGALLDERDKRKEAQAKAEALERQLAEMRAQQQQPPADMTPDERVQAALYQQNLRASRRFAEREYGKDVIATVHDWAATKCDADPIFNQQMLSAEDPYEAAYQAFNREQIVSKVTPDRLAAFEAWEAAQAAASAQAQAAPTPSTAPAPPPPRSLATAPGNGAAGSPHIPAGPGEAFRNVITR